MDTLPTDDTDVLMVSELEPSLKQNASNDAQPTQLPAGEIRNVFELTDYIAATSNVDKTALDALNMMDMDEEGEGGAAATAPDAPAGASDLVQVSYNPNEPAKRLGRPRKHLNGVQPHSPDSLASDNMEKATISTFRFDERPIVGPGSRGGDALATRPSKGQLVESSAAKKRKQAVLNLTQSEGVTSLGLAPKEEGVEVKDVKAEEVNAEEVEAEEVKAEEVKQEEAVEVVDVDNTEDRVEGKAEKVAILADPDTFTVRLSISNDALKKLSARKKPKKKANLTFRNKISRTTIVREKNRVTRTLPGPLVPLHYDLYDDNLILAESNAAMAAEKLALGFPTRPCPYAYDIMYAIAWLLQFESIIDVGPLGPEDFETGLGLKGPHRDDISPVMKDLFRQLLTLVLNRKKPVLPGGERPAIQELQTQYISLGLPLEWRDDSMVRRVTKIPCDPALDRVDLTKPEIELEETVEYEAPTETLNPFHYKDFEELGLAGIKHQHDRLIMIRCLMLWSLSASNVVKTHMVNVVNQQEIPGERDTLYGSRAVLKGFFQTLELKKEVESKLAKKGKSSSRSANSTPVPESNVNYIDPSSDPLAHPMALRLNEFIVGDCGFHVGRFYLVRMAAPASGGLSSIDKMRRATKDAARVRSSVPSGFKLYVEDVHQVLLDSLGIFGPEFDARGKEIRVKVPKYDDTKSWHEVAQNSTELNAFVDHLERRLGIRDRDAPDLISQSSVAYRPILFMYQYLKHLLPLLEQFENMDVSLSDKRGPRTKKVDYNVQRWEEESEEEEEEIEVEEEEEEDYSQPAAADDMSEDEYEE